MMRYEADYTWHVYFLDDDDNEVLWCQSTASDAVLPGEHTWVMYENGKETLKTWMTNVL